MQSLRSISKCFAATRLLQSCVISLGQAKSLQTEVDALKLTGKTVQAHLTLAKHMAYLGSFAEYTEHNELESKALRGAEMLTLTFLICLSNHRFIRTGSDHSSGSVSDISCSLVGSFAALEFDELEFCLQRRRVAHKPFSSFFPRAILSLLSVLDELGHTL